LRETLELADDAAVPEARLLLARVKASGVRKCAAIAGVDAGQLTRLVSGERNLTTAMIEKLRRGLAR